MFPLQLHTFLQVVESFNDTTGQTHGNLAAELTFYSIVKKLTLASPQAATLGSQLVGPLNFLTNEVPNNF